MATIRKKHRGPVPVFQRDPGPWSRLLIDWLATLAVIMIFGLVMLFSASYTTGYLRMGDSFHYIKQQAHQAQPDDPADPDGGLIRAHRKAVQRLRRQKNQ